MASKLAQWFGFGDAEVAAQHFPNQGNATNGYQSPWQVGNLAPFVWSDIYGLDVPGAPVTRVEALKVPAVAKARSVLLSLIASRPLKVYDGTTGLPLAKQPTWTYRSDTGVSPYQRTLGMIDDHLFSEATLLVVSRGAKGDILDMVHLPYDRWSVNSDGQIVVDGNIAKAEDVIWIPGPGPGLLTIGAETIRGARAMERAWAGRVRNPTPTILLNQKEAGSLTQDEVNAYLTAIRAARQDPDGTVAFIPYEINAVIDAGSSLDLFDTGRNGIRIDVANLTNLPASLLDGSLSTSTLTYSTAEGKRNEVYDYSIPYWINSIEQGLSLDNVVPRGQYVRFDFTDLIETIASPDGAKAED